MDPAQGLLFFIAAILLIGIGLYLRSEWEKRHFRTEHYTIKTRKLLKGLRILFISDMHGQEFGEGNEELLSEIHEIGPDLILIGGDMITCGKHHEDPPGTSACIHLCEALCQDYPVIYAEGNHELRFRQRFPEDFQVFMEHLMQNPGLRYLRDDAAVFRSIDETSGEDEEIDIYGVSLDMDYYAPQKPGFGHKKAMPKEHLSSKLGITEGSASGPCDKRYSILLMHSPLYLKEAAGLGVDLVLSGHFHGGTIRLPHLGGLMTPQLQFFIKECAGEFCEGGTHMIVTRGLGTHSIRIRLNDRPELSVIDILPKMV